MRQVCPVVIRQKVIVVEVLGTETKHKVHCYWKMKVGTSRMDGRVSNVMHEQRVDYKYLETAAVLTHWYLYMSVFLLTH